MSNKRPTIAIIGRPNVGKSTFTNRLIGERKSIVDDLPGVTRDRIYFDTEWLGKKFTIIDTGGIIPDSADDIMLSIFDQAKIAAEEADVIIFMVDGRDGINPADFDIAQILRQSKKQVFLAVNKIDAPEKIPLINEFYELGLGNPYAVSALHGSGGLGDMLEDIIKILPEKEEVEEEKQIKVAIVGKPNAGKSSLTNSLLGKNRVIVSDIAGTTRDTINSNVVINNQEYVLIDTAGIRKKSKVEYGVEKFAVTRAINAIDEADVVILMVDVVEGFTDQDKKIVAITQEAGKGLIIAMNKWDLIENKTSVTINEHTKKLRDDAPYLDYVPVIFISALEKQRLTKIFDLVNEVYKQATKRVSTSLFNKIILEAYTLNPPIIEKNKRLRIYYATQVSVAPPVFVIFVNDSTLVKPSYKRYIEKKLREAFGFNGVPFKVVFKNRKEKEKK
ncbi:MAG: ribosome biogenesis GTPase Der [Candidatus Gastranaerophilales bacterium]|nr:ribosome biogenesis GTPase Der [Candidatus Gastranaerophilales bacterium]